MILYWCQEFIAIHPRAAHTDWQESKNICDVDTTRFRWLDGIIWLLCKYISTSKYVLFIYKVNLSFIGEVTDDNYKCCVWHIIYICVHTCTYKISLNPSFMLKNHLLWMKLYVYQYFPHSGWWWRILKCYFVFLFY